MTYLLLQFFFMRAHFYNKFNVYFIQNIILLLLHSGTDVMFLINCIVVIFFYQKIFVFTIRIKVELYF